MSAEIEHGGALDKAVARFGGRPQDWLDLSTGINPEHFPLPELTPEIWNRLPDEGLLQETLRLARSYYRLNEKAPIVAAPGTQGLIQLVPTLIAPSTVAILGPTYQEHAASFAASGWKVVQCVTLDEIPSEATAAVIVNPNNPDGRVISKEALLQLAQKLGARGGFLVVDEAFADAHEAVTIAANAEDAPMIVLKSFGKFFGLAGVRLGFAITGGRFVEALERRLGPWAVSGPALAIANHAFSDAGTLADYRTRIDLRRAELSAVLDKSGLREIGGTALFSLVEHVGAIGIYTRLCERHILIRKFDYAPRWLRIGLPLDDVALARFEKALKF
ncbi:MULTISPECIES: threonine-phosphate decarboxylase CobD [Brucella]|uniref:threonine-phosphate decarboxylase n=1 Tax=Brucella lupini TaxID=255457 RepID=A0A256GY72_9HYPH|nr:MULTISPECIES: threonine-phosphate decarboxylase CobD [Brucella]RNL43332.1 threonine-phosphate decarboxylase [Ochrobactrum sp. MH181795]KAB2700622.1 threonine-phosphate decarboxylase [Brucella lupini]KAB2728590.1 threonine-phosphate decarboxylase [Brucella anthropi]KAB2745763.1 threonine-phosphate decarboxylase [Brucella anthropi]KAB2800525.1 threonine-phosphate decarboxylase [Brucella anthropi]